MSDHPNQQYREVADANPDTEDGSNLPQPAILPAPEETKTDTGTDEGGTTKTTGDEGNVT